MNHRKSKNKCVIAAASLLLPTLVHAQSGAASSVDPVSIASDTTEVMLPDQHINEVTITKRQTVRSMGGAINGQAMLKGELFKAACCNLGESFVNNPSVDVNYSDAATGAKQIKLLGLGGTYVQLSLIHI